MWTRTRIRVDFVLLFTVFLPVILCSEVNVLIRPESKKIEKPAGKTFVVTCAGEAEDVKLFTNMKWIGSQGEITDDINAPVYVTQEQPGSLFLYFNNPTLEMSGQYNCTALYDNSVTREDSIHITFYHAITFEDCPTVQALVIGTSGTIRCRANANPAASVNWMKGPGGKEQLDKDRYHIQNDGILVHGVQESDAGLFRVRAMVQQTGELQSRDIEVEVHVPPVITALKERVEVIEGEREDIHCQASGNPPPRFNWFDPMQRNLSAVDGYIVDRAAGTLTIRNVRKEYAGIYRCQAVNSAGNAEKNLELAVLVKPEIRQFMNVTQVQDKDTKLECRAFGEPAPEMAIRKDGHDQPIASGDERMRVERYTEGDESVLRLTIQRTMRKDDGLYYCSATNQAGRAEQVGHVTVEFAPDMKNTPATERKTWSDNPVNLTCIAEAIPNATITWYFRGEVIHPNRIYTIFGESSHSSLLVRPSHNEPGGLSIYGKYKCEGRNQFGNASIEIDLQEARVPGRLQQIGFDKQTATTITFHLRGMIDDGGLPITSYVIRYREASALAQEESTFEWPEGSSYILEQLKPRTEYFYRFAAKNDAGIGDFSEEKTFITPSESAPEVPVILQPGGNVSRYSDKFVVRWSVPQDNGKPIQKFTLRYFQVEPSGGSDWKSVGKDTTVDIRNWDSGSQYELSGLKPNAYYKVEVRAYNEIGYSQPASQTFQTATGTTTKEQRIEEGGSILTTPAIVALVIVAVLVVLGLLDVTCYLRYHCGLLYCLRTSVCGRSHASDKAKEAVEDGKGKERREEFLRDGGPNEDTPMIESVGAKDTKGADVNSEHDYKNKSPKGSKSSIAKDSLV